MPSGAALLVATGCLLAAGFGRPALRALCLSPAAASAWCTLTAAASVLNLQLPRVLAAGWQPLLNPGGTLVPLAFALFLAAHGRPPRESTRPGGGADAWAVVAGMLGGAALTVAQAWGQTLGLPWPGTAGGLAVGGLLALSLAGSARSVLLAATAALPSAAVAALAAAAVGWSAWPASVGGGGPFDAAVTALLAAQAACRLPAPRRIVQGAPARAGSTAP